MHRLKWVREYLGFSILDIAKATGILSVDIADIEVGYKAYLTDEVIQKLSDFYKVDIAYLTQSDTRRYPPETDQAELDQFAQYLRARRRYLTH